MDDSVDWAANAQTEYIGPVGHEKKLHKTHFTVSKVKKLKGKIEKGWVQFSPGRYKKVWS